MGTRSAGYSAVQQWWNSFLDILEVTRLCSHHFHIIAARSHKSTELDHFHIIEPRSIPSPRRTAQVHRARPLRLMAPRRINKAFTATAFCWFQNAASRCLCWQNTRAARLRVLGCRLLGFELCCALMMTRSFPGFPGLTQTHTLPFWQYLQNAWFLRSYGK